jgi:hypothetical protein
MPKTEVLLGSWAALMSFALLVGSLCGAAGAAGTEGSRVPYRLHKFCAHVIMLSAVTNLESREGHSCLHNKQTRLGILSSTCGVHGTPRKLDHKLLVLHTRWPGCAKTGQSFLHAEATDLDEICAHHKTSSVEACTGSHIWIHRQAI